MNGRLITMQTVRPVQGRMDGAKDVIDGSSQLKSEFVPQVIIDEGWVSSVNGIGQYNAGLDGSGGALIGEVIGGLLQVYLRHTWAPYLQWESCWFPMRSSLILR